MASDGDFIYNKRNIKSDSSEKIYFDEKFENPSQFLIEQNNPQMNKPNPNLIYLEDNQKLIDPNQLTNENTMVNQYADDIQPFDKEQTPFNYINRTDNQMEIEEEGLKNKKRVNESQSNNSRENVINGKCLEKDKKVKKIKIFINDKSFFQSFENNITSGETAFIPKTDNNFIFSKQNIDSHKNQSPNIISQQQSKNIPSSNISLFELDEEKEKCSENEINLKEEEEEKGISIIMPVQENQKRERPRGRRKKDYNYIETEYHGKEETGNAKLKIIRSFMKSLHIFIWDYISSYLGEENKNIKIYLNEKGMFEGKLKIADKDKGLIEKKIHLASPNITEIIGKPKDPNNEYHKIDSTVERYQKLFKENIITLYKQYSWPKRLKGNKKTGDKNLDRITRGKTIGKYQLLMEVFINTLLETEKDSKEKQIKALLNLKLIDFLTIYLNDKGETNQKKLIRVDQNEYGFEFIDLGNFAVYDNCKHKFSDKEDEQEKYRTNIIKIMTEEKKRREKSKKD